jgi:hypothetical protein
MSKSYKPRDKMNLSTTDKPTNLSNDMLYMDGDDSNSKILDNTSMYCEPMKWMPNEHSKHCLICERKFNITRRKHHCRGCGILVCNQCSP